MSTHCNGRWTYKTECDLLAHAFKLRALYGREDDYLAHCMTAELRDLARAMPWDASPKYRDWIVRDLKRWGVEDAEEFNPRALAGPQLRLASVDGSKVS